MRVLQTFAIILILLLFGGVASERVSAQPAAFGEGPWEVVSHCGPEQTRPEDLLITANNANKLRNHLNDGRYCSDSSSIEIIDFSTVSDSIRYCDHDQEYVGARNRQGNLLDVLDAKCCPENFPVSRKINNNWCCPAGSQPQLWKNECEGGVEGQYSMNALRDNNWRMQSPITLGTGPVYSCPQEGCLTDSAHNLKPNNTDLSPIVAANAAENLCYARGSQRVGAPNDFCLAGQWVTKEELEVANLSNAVSVCARLDAVERERCFECFGRNPATDEGLPQTFVYSSIGCIDTSRDAFITRLFQLGFGMLSGIAVVRIMFAAVKMQSDDPAKHQEGRDMITSAVAALVVLAAAIPILQYIGINLLSLFDS